MICTDDRIADFNVSELTRASEIRSVVLGAGPLPLEDFVAVARYRAELSFSPEYESRVQASWALADRFLSENRVVYGLTTGFGDNVRTIIPQEQARQLQVNILRSHAVSVGKPLAEEAARAVWLMQLLSLGRGNSGISLKTLSLIRDCLNRGVTPIVPGEGSVQYLAVEAQTNLVLIGEGRATYRGEALSGGEALKKAGLQPIELGPKEGLCLTNGANSATALAALALYDTAVAVQSADVAAAMFYEAYNGNTMACDPRLHSLKKQPEQAGVAANILQMLWDSGIAAKNRGVSVQDGLALRQTPQMQGAVKRFVKDAATSILEEMASCSDNPVLWPEPDTEEGGLALMGANFDGTYACGAADMLCFAAANLGKLVERRVDKLTNRHFNAPYPPFLATEPGVDNGYMIVQYTAAGLINEIRGLSLPSTADSIPTCANWEDPVSMGWWAACKAYKVASKLSYMVAIEIMVLCRALDLLRELSDLDKDAGALSTLSREIHGLVRQVVPPVEGDRHFGPDIEEVYALVRRGEVVRSAERVSGPLAF